MKNKLHHKVISVLVLLLISFLGYTYWPKNDAIYNLPTEKLSFKPGEEILYNVHFSIFGAADAKMVIMDNIHDMNGRPCYPEDDVVIPLVCRGEKETARGIKMGVESAKRELGLPLN